MSADVEKIGEDRRRQIGMRLLQAAYTYDAEGIRKILDRNPSMVDFADEKGRQPITVVLKRAHARDRGEIEGMELVKLLVERGATVDSKVLLRAYINSTIRIYHFLERIYMDRNPLDKGIGDMIRTIAIAKGKKAGQPFNVGTGAPKRYVPGL